MGNASMMARIGSVFGSFLVSALVSLRGCVCVWERGGVLWCVVVCGGVWWYVM